MTGRPALPTGQCSAEEQWFSKKQRMRGRNLLLLEGHNSMVMDGGSSQMTARDRECGASAGFKNCQMQHIQTADNITMGGGRVDS